MTSRYITDPFRSRKTLWQCRFRNHVEVAGLGGSLVGNPEVNRGLFCDGSTNYATFPLTNEISSPQLTIKVVFTPDFEAGDAIDAWLFDTDLTKFYLRHYGTTQRLGIYANGVYCGQNVNYASIWKKGKKNTIICSVESGVLTRAWLNGVTWDSLATPTYSIVQQSQLRIGCRFNATSMFPGIIHEVSFHQGKWTQEDVDADLDNSTYNLENKASLWCDMRDCYTVGAGKFTTDKSRYGHTVQLGDGAGANEPDFLNPGFDLVRTDNDYLRAVGFDANSTEVSFVCCFSPYFILGGDANYRYLFCSDPGAEYYVYFWNTGAIGISAGGTVIANIPFATCAPYFNAYGKNVLIFALKSGDSDAYLNGHKIMDGNATAFSATSEDHMDIGRRNNNTHWYNGLYHHFSVRLEKLSSIQARYITRALQEGRL